MSRKTYPLLYFAYGANTHRDHMAHRCPTAVYVGNANLDDYRLIFRSVADVIPVKGQTTVCAIWEIRESDERSLDSFEGYPHHYTKQYAEIKLNGKKRLAMFYVMAGGRKDRHEPPASYERCLRDGYRQCGMSPAQIDNAIRDAHHSAERHLRYSGKWMSGDGKPAPRPAHRSDTDRLISGIRGGATPRTQTRLFDEKSWSRIDEANSELTRMEKLRAVFPDYPDWFLNDVGFFKAYD